MKFKRIFMLGTMLCFAFLLKGQVTIGSNISPNSGALLDLKEFNDTVAANGGRNALGGLLLPRIGLTGLNTLTDFGVSDSEYTDYIGLTIYNLNQCLDYGITDNRGVYTWDGAEWIKLNNKTQSSSVFEFTDPRDGEVYMYREFGDAGTWMLENMRAKTYAQGGTAPVLGLVQGANIDIYNKQYVFPTNNTNSDGTDDSYYNLLPAIGLLYNWAAATNNENIPEDNGQPLEQGQLTIGDVIGANEVENVVSPGNGEGKVQGICPDGWHVPSDREWNQLEKELTNNASKYSTAEDGVWDESWEIVESGSRGITAVIMKTPCLPPGMSGADITGKSLPASQGGFCFFMTGYYHSSNLAFIGYANQSFARSSSSGADSMTNKSSYHRSLTRYNDWATRTAGHRNNMMPVRCKKD